MNDICSSNVHDPCVDRFTQVCICWLDVDERNGGKRGRFTNPLRPIVGAALKRDGDGGLFKLCFRLRSWLLEGQLKFLEPTANGLPWYYLTNLGLTPGDRIPPAE